MIWPQVSLAQMAALFPDYRVDIIDAIPHRMTWETFERLLREKRPRYYITQVTAPTLQNDMYGVFLAKSLRMTTMAFGTHVTPMPRATMEAYPALDFVLRGEPELTLRELVDTLERKNDKAQISNPESRIRNSKLQGWWPEAGQEFRERLRKLFVEADPGWRPAWLNLKPATCNLKPIKGLVWRHNGEIVINSDRVVTSRGCPGGCRFCIKHVSYGNAVRFRSPENVLAEIEQLVSLGMRNMHMYADLFTLNRDHVMGICREILSRGLKVRWTCNSRVDFVDEEMLRAMAHAGCWMISWGIESGDDGMLRRMHKGTTTDQVERALRWAKRAGIMNWGYFIIGLPGETDLLRGGGERLVPPRHTLGGRGHGPLDGAGLPPPAGGGTGEVGAAGVPGVGLPAGTNMDLPEDAAGQPLPVAADAGDRAGERGMGARIR
jgi:radical SAM superfamily enzyme YgiQ (UPF0313 family)